MMRWPYPRVAAHRGGGKLAPENTLAAIDLGARLGHTMVEFDAKLSADGVAFLLHDDTVNRTSNGRGRAARLRYDELSALDAGRWRGSRFAGERMPTLEQAAKRCISLSIAANVEIKPCAGRDLETGKRVAEEAARLWAGAEPSALLSSYSYAALAAARDAAPDVPRAILFDRLPADWREQAASLGCVSLHVHHRRLDETLVARIKDTGLFVFAYTVNHPGRARRLARWGVDTVCTDRIDLIGPHALDDLSQDPQPADIRRA